jgi:hypothetical protein
MGKLFGTAAVALALTVGAAPEAPAMAKQLLFTISGDDPTITFVLPEDPTPVNFTPRFSFQLSSIPAIVGGSPSNLFTYFFITYPGRGAIIFNMGSVLTPFYMKARKCTPARKSTRCLVPVALS